MAQLGAAVTAVDKAPLDPAVAALPNVSAMQESAFGLEPRPVDWLVCDVIAYPERLLALMQRWIGSARRIVCTVKFQGQTDFAAQDGFAAIEGSCLMHLFHNKHELTFVWASAVIGQAQVADTIGTAGADTDFAVDVAHREPGQG
jgi:23S rRNA (cytidine2498-2'-O)-methyltransferase